MIKPRILEIKAVKKIGLGDPEDVAGSSSQTERMSDATQLVNERTAQWMGSPLKRSVRLMTGMGRLVDDVKLPRLAS